MPGGWSSDKVTLRPYTSSRQVSGLLVEYWNCTTEVEGSVPTFVQLQATLSYCVLRQAQLPTLSEY